MDIAQLSCLTEDFDTVLSVDLENNQVILEKAKPGLKKEFNLLTNVEYDIYQKQFCEKYIVNDDKKWFYEKTNLDLIKNQLSKNSPYRVNYRIKKSDGKIIYYRSKFCKYMMDGEFKKILIAGTSVQNQELDDYENFENKIITKYNAVISGISKGYACIVYFDTKNNTKKCFYISSVFKKLMSDSLGSDVPENKYLSCIDQLIYKEDLEHFKKDTAKETIVNSLKFIDSYEVFFRLSIKENLFNYKLTIFRDPNNKYGFISALMHYDEQVISQSIHKEELHSHELIESKLENELRNKIFTIQEINQKLEKLNKDIIYMMGDITEARDLESGDHIRRVSNYTRILAEQLKTDCPELGFTENTVELLANASSLHDIGKISIPDAILLKPGKLTPEEFRIMKTHTSKGCELLKKAPVEWDKQYIQMSMEICKYHHEKYDGKGYPYGLKGENIPISAQVVSIIDCYDALSSKRVYKEAYSKEESINMILNGECGVFSPRIIKSFLNCKQKIMKMQIYP